MGYPSENSLVVNGTHQLLTRIHGGYSEIAARAPTRYEEHQSGGGYDIEYPFAIRLQLQYKAPKSHVERGVRFKLDRDQITTLAAREPGECAFYACPVIKSDIQLKNTLKETYFVDAQAIQAGTSQLYIPPNSPHTAEAKIHDSSDKEGYYASEKNYYNIPSHAVYTWPEMKSRIAARNIGLSIMEGGSRTKEFDSFVERLHDLWSLHDDNLDSAKTDGGYSYDNNPVENLVSFAVSQFRDIYANSDYSPPNVDRHEQKLRSSLEAHSAARYPEITGIRRAQEIVAQFDGMNS